MPTFCILVMAGCLCMFGAADATLSISHIQSFDYPYLAHLAGAEGVVQIVLTVGGDGEVRSTRVVSGNSLLADGASKTLKSWTFSPCKRADGKCEYPMSIRFVLRGELRSIGECNTEFQFDNPSRIVVTSQPARAIVD